MCTCVMMQCVALFLSSVDGIHMCMAGSWQLAMVTKSPREKGVPVSLLGTGVSNSNVNDGCFLSPDAEVLCASLTYHSFSDEFKSVSSCHSGFVCCQFTVCGP